MSSFDNIQYPKYLIWEVLPMNEYLLMAHTTEIFIMKEHPFFVSIEGFHKHNDVVIQYLVEKIVTVERDFYFKLQNRNIDIQLVYGDYYDNSAKKVATLFKKSVPVPNTEEYNSNWNYLNFLCHQWKGFVDKNIINLQQHADISI